MSERFDKGTDYTNFWDEVYGDNGLSAHDIEQIHLHYHTVQTYTSQSFPVELDFDDDLPF